MHANAVDLTGRTVGRLTVLCVAGRTSDGHIAWMCSCACGKDKVISSNSLTRASPVQSCGCRNADTAASRKNPDGPWNEGKSYVIRNGEHCYKTRHGWAKAAIRYYGNKCERCGWNAARCDVHHREPKSFGGRHTLENAIVLCPNCHRIDHEARNAR